jgi:KilA-N domain
MNNSIIKNWNNKRIRFREDGYVCISDMAAAAGKRVANWTRLDSTNEYLQAFSLVTQIRVTALLDVSHGTESWAHPKVALRFAQWCNVDFAIQVDCWVDELLKTGTVSIAQSQQLEPIDLKNLDEVTIALLISQEYWDMLDDPARPDRDETWLARVRTYRVVHEREEVAERLDPRLLGMSDLVLGFVYAWHDLKNPLLTAISAIKTQQVVSDPVYIAAAQEFQSELDRTQLIPAASQQQLLADAK